MRSLWCSILVLFLPLFSLAQENLPVPVPLDQRPPKILDALNAASMAQPEIAADLMLRLVESGKVRGSNWQWEVLNNIDRVVDDVRHPVRRRMTRIGGASVDTRSGYLSYAYDLKLDRLSLTSRLVRQFQKLDRDRARQILINTASDLKLKRLECTDPLVYDVTDIYTTVGEFASASFSKKEIEEGVRALFLSTWIDGVESPAQIGPTLDLVLKFSSSPSEKSLLFQAMSRAIDRDFADDRSFSHALEFDRLDSRIAQIISGQGDLHLKEELVTAFRSFLVKNLNRPRCSDNKITSADELEAKLIRFNFLFPAKPIKPDEVSSDDSDGAAEIFNYWWSPSAKKLQNELRVLRMNKPDAGDTSAADIWNNEVSNFIAQMDSWESSDSESADDIFNQKCVLYRALLGVVSDRPLKTDVFSRFHRYLSGSSMYSRNVTEWLVHVQWLSGVDRNEFNRQSATSANAGLRALAAFNALDR
jgi:hypothetical protein